MSTPASPHSNSAGVGQQAVGQQAVSQWGVSQYPAPKRRKTTTIVGIVAVVVLIVAGGVFYAVNLSGVKQGFVDDRFRFSNAWANGGEHVWVLSDIPDTIDSPVVAQNDRMVIVTKDPVDPNGRVLTGYDIEGNDPSLEWSRNIVIDPELEGPVMLMDTYVVYAGQIFDIYDGEFRDSAWARDAKIVIDPSWPDSIACVPGRECRGNTWETGEEWRIPFEGTDVAPIIQDDLELFTLVYSAGARDSRATMINVRTGEWMRLKSPLDGVVEVTALKDGWLTYDNDFRPLLISLDGTVETLDGPGTGARDEKRLVITPGPVPTLDDFRLQYALDKDPGDERVVGDFDSASCVFTVHGNDVDFSKEKSGTRSLEGTGTSAGSGDSIGSDPSGETGGGSGCETPMAFVATSPDGNVVSTLVMTENRTMDYVLLDASTGDVVWRVPLGDGVVVPRPDLAIVLDDGVLSGWSSVS